MLRKVETLEQYIDELETSNISYNEFYTQIKTAMGNAYSYIRQLDRVGSFESDDETGSIFKEIKDVIEMLNKGI